MREDAEITSVNRVGDGYKIKGVSHGKQAEFFVHSHSIDTMQVKDAKDFMRRTIANIAKRKEE